MIQSVIRKRWSHLVFAGVAVLLVGSAAFAGRPGTGNLYHDGDIVRTVVPPAAMPHEGTDDFYAVGNGVEGQLGIAGVAPGDRDYRGGKWAFHLVTFQVEPYLLTSEDAVLAAEQSGDATVERIPANDFKCPIQP